MLAGLCGSKSIERDSIEKSQEDHACLTLFWQCLNKIKSFSYHAKSKSQEEGSLSGIGKGEVIIKKEGETVLIYQEKGTWKTDAGKEMDFSNAYRWSLDRDKNRVSLEHLRYGIHNPVFLLHLTPSGKSSLDSVDFHLCNTDSYFGKVSFAANYLRLHWKIIGPKKDQEVTYCYTL